MQQRTTARGIGAAARGGVLGAMLLVGACVDNVNNDLTIGSAPDQVTLPSLNPDARIVSPEATPSTIPAPSVVGVMRDNWQGIDFKVPIEYVRHPATSAVNPTYTDENARQLGQYPTDMSCIERPTTRSYGDEAWEGVAAPFYCGFDLVMGIPRMFMAPPWTLERSPGTAYERRADDVPAFYKIAPATEPAAAAPTAPPPPPPPQPAAPAGGKN